MLLTMRKAVILVALFSHCVPAIPQQLPAMPIQAAQASPTQELPPQPPPPPKKPATATPPEDTGMAGQVANVVLPPAAGISASVIALGVFGVIGAGLALGSSDDDSSAATTTGTR